VDTPAHLIKFFGNFIGTVGHYYFDFIVLSIRFSEKALANFFVLVPNSAYFKNKMRGVTSLKDVGIR